MGHQQRLAAFFHRGRQRVQQLGHQHRRRQLAVVAHAAAGVGQQQPVARGQQQVEEQVAFVEAALAVAPARAQRHQVELRFARRARKGAVVQPDGADHPVGQAAQAAHRREGDAAARHAAAGGVVQCLFQRMAQHRQRQGRGAGFGQAAQRHRGHHRLHGLAQLAQVFQLIGFGRDEVVHRLLQHRLPAGRRVRLPTAPVQLAQRLGITPEGAQGVGAGAFHVARGQAAGKGLVGLGRQRITQEQPRQAVVQRVLGLGRHAEAAAVGRVQRPAHAGFGHVLLHLVQRRRVQAEAARHHRLLQQAVQAAGRQARAHQRQQLQHRPRAAVDAAARPAGDGKGQLPLGRCGAEHRIDQGRRGVQVGRDHQHVGRMQAGQRRVGEHGQQLVLQHFQLAGERVAAVHLDAAVGRHAGGFQLHQVEHRVLHLGQQRAARGGVEHRVVHHLLAGGFHQQVDLRLRLPAPGGQQVVAFFVQRFLAAGGQVGQAAAVDHLEPVFPAGVEHIHLQLHAAPQRLQQPDVLRRHGRQREHMGAGGQAGRSGQCRAVRAFERADQLLRRVLLQGQLGHDAAPQRGLPGFVGTGAVVHCAQVGRLAGFPAGQPVGAVGDVLLQQAGAAAGQVQAHHRVGLGQVGGQARMGRHELLIAEGGIHPPGHHVG